MLPEYSARCAWCHTLAASWDLDAHGVCQACNDASGLALVAETLGTGIPAAFVEPPALDVRDTPDDPNDAGGTKIDSDA